MLQTKCLIFFLYRYSVLSLPTLPTNMIQLIQNKIKAFTTILGKQWFYFISMKIQCKRCKGSRMGRSVKVSLWCVTLLMNTKFRFFLFLFLF